MSHAIRAKAQEYNSEALLISKSTTPQSFYIDRKSISHTGNYYTRFRPVIEDWISGTICCIRATFSFQIRKRKNFDAGRKISGNGASIFPEINGVHDPKKKKL